MNIFAKSLMYQKTYIGNTETYKNLVKQYLYYLLIYSHGEFQLYFKSSNYPNERFMILYYNQGYCYNRTDEGGFVVIYDFKSTKGKLFYYCEDAKFEYRLVDINGAISNSALGVSLVLSGEFDEFDGDENFVMSDDPIEDIGYGYYQYFDIINDGDDETVLSQLNASLMKLSKIMNL